MSCVFKYFFLKNLFQTKGICNSSVEIKWHFPTELNNEAKSVNGETLMKNDTAREHVECRICYVITRG